MKPLQSLAAQLKPYLHNDFQRKVFDAIMSAFEAVPISPLRLNHFASAFRELVSQVLADLAPAADVEKCSWFKPDDTSKNGITRGHKIDYIIHGGLDPTYVEETLNLDIQPVRKKLLKSVDALSKFTHFRKESFDVPDAQANEFAQGACAALVDFLRTADQARRELRALVEKRIHDDVVDAAVSETIASIDELAPHHSLNEVYVHDIEVDQIDSGQISFTAYGSVSVELQWGSSSDFRRGDGAAMLDSYPLTCKFVSSVDNPDEAELVEGSLSVDTSSWYASSSDEDEDEPEELKPPPEL